MTGYLVSMKRLLNGEFVWQKVNSWISWVKLARIRNSFFSKALTALSMSSLILANLPNFAFKVGLESGTFEIILAGSLLFILGYLLFGVFVPAELGQAGEVHDHVQRMKSISDDAFVASRIIVAESLIERLRTRTRLRPAEALIKRLVGKLLVMKKKGSGFSENEAASFFHADLTLRQYDAPFRRACVAGCLAIGTLLILFPTIRNVLRAFS